MSNPGLSDVRRRIEQIAEAMGLLQAELGDLELVERVLVRLSKATPDMHLGERLPTSELQGSEATAYGEDNGSSATKTKDEFKKETTETLITALLREKSHQTWWTTAEIIDGLALKTGRAIPTNTVGPTLSLMKRNGTITRNGYRVALTTFLPQSELMGMQLGDHTEAEIEDGATTEEVTPS